MVAIALIVTGDMEFHGLAASLTKVFPDVEFSTQKVDGFTSTKVSWPPPSSPRGVQSSLQKFVKAFLAALVPGRRDPRPDYVFGIEDLELANREQPADVIQAFRCAVQAELETRRQGMNANSYEKFLARAKDNCSFHLLVPMAETYFYADPTLLPAIGCTRAPQLEPNCDVERFRTIDTVYLEDVTQPPPAWACEPSARPYHPKRYLQFLLHPIGYSETDEGVDALRSITWDIVLAERERTLYLRSLFQDLADALGLEISRFPGDAHPLTSDYRNQNRILRNC